MSLLLLSEQLLNLLTFFLEHLIELLRTCLFVFFVLMYKNRAQDQLVEPF